MGKTGKDKEEDENGDSMNEQNCCNECMDDMLAQKVAVWRPLYLAERAVFTYALAGVLCLAIGLGLENYLTRRVPDDVIVDYTQCKWVHNNLIYCNSAAQNLTWVHENGPCTCKLPMEKLSMGMRAKNIRFYYGFQRFFRSYKDYFTSRDDYQLAGDTINGTQTCKPLQHLQIHIDNTTNKTVQMAYAPCGLVADSLFNDTFGLTHMATNPVQPDAQAIVQKIPMTFVGIAPKYLVGTMYNNPEDLKSMWNQTSKPRSWSDDFYNDKFIKDGYKYEPLIIWMRGSPFPTFRKTYAKLNYSELFFEAGLPKGTYFLTITYNFPVSGNARKRFIIGADLGRRHRFRYMAWAYQLLAFILFILSLFFIVVDLKWCKLQKSVNRFIIKSILSEVDGKIKKQTV